MVQPNNQSSELIKFLSLLCVVLPFVFSIRGSSVELSELSLALLLSGLVLLQLVVVKKHVILALLSSLAALLSEFFCFLAGWGEELLLAVAICMYLLVVFKAFSKAGHDSKSPLPGCRPCPSQTDLEAVVEAVVETGEDCAEDDGKGEEDDGAEESGEDLPLDESQKRRIFERLLEIMDEEKPYLNDRLSLYAMSLKVCTNKTYVSKIINEMTGKNFRRFVNEYRVRYSAGLIRADHSLRVGELAVQSGFHNTTTYNMAFKLYYGCTPGEYIHQFRLRDRSSEEQMQLFGEESFLPDAQG